MNFLCVPDFPAKAGDFPVKPGHFSVFYKKYPENREGGTDLFAKNNLPHEARQNGSEKNQELTMDYLQPFAAPQ